LRHGGEVAEVPFAHLLLAASVVEFHDLDPRRIVEVRRSRVVERDVSVFAESDEREIERTLGEQGGIAGDLVVDIWGIAFEIVHGSGPASFVNPRAQPVPETCRMLGVYSDVLVHMKDHHALPVDGFAHQSVDQASL
jgi:hypothetical protein